MTALKLVVDNEAIPEVCDVAEGFCDLKDAVQSLRDRMMIPRAYLWETVGKPMLEAGQKTKTLDGFVYHVAEPQEREYCTCHLTLLYLCPSPINERAGIIVQRDAVPSFSISRVTEKRS